MGRLLGSPRARRRAAWAAGLLAVVGGIAVAVVLVPKRTEPADHLRPGGQVVRTPASVPMTAARREAVNRLLDAFMPAAVERRSPLRALPLVTRSFRAGVTRGEWARGNLPVFPYRARDRRFHGWTLNYSFPREISVDLLVHPSAKESLGAEMYTAVFKEVGRRWLIDSFVARASFAPSRKQPRILAQNDFMPETESKPTAQLSKTWLLVPAALFALVVLTPIAVGISRGVRSRRAWRAYHAERATLD